MFLDKLFRKREIKSELEIFIKSLKSKDVDGFIKSVSKEMKAPTAQALGILVFVDIFVSSLRTIGDSIPAELRKNRAFPYDKLIAESVAFYYLYLLGNEDDSDLDNDGKYDTPLIKSLKAALLLSDSLIPDRTDSVPLSFIFNRTAGYQDDRNQGKSDITERFINRIMKAWAIPPGEYQELGTTLLHTQIFGAISRIPFDTLRVACEKILNTYQK